MGSRLKEDEKNEKAIRALLRKPSNRRCINCNSLGPQYVCLNFSTFVCTRCSGIHREFTHRVKSVSMSKFSSQEVANLEAGGNESARATFFKDWDSQREPFPDSSNEERLREFIKMVYVGKRFSGERPLPRNKGGDREETYENRRSDPRSNYRADSRSPSYEDRYAEHGRNPKNGYDREETYDNRRSDPRSNYRAEERGARFDEKRSPARFESERGRYDERNYNETRRYDERPRYETHNRHQYEDRSNEKGSRGYGNSSPPPVRPVKEILGDDVPPLRVDSPQSQANGVRNTDKQQISQDDRWQRFGSSSSFGSVDGNAPAVSSSVKREDSASLIDFSAELDPPAPKEQPDPFDLKSATQPAVDPLSNTGWATFEPAAAALSLGASPQAPAVSAVHGLFGGLEIPPSFRPVGQAPAVPSSQDLLADFGNPSNLRDGNSHWATQWTAPGVQPVDASGNNWSSSSTLSSQSWNAFSTTVSDSSSSQAAQGSQPLDSVNTNNTTGATTQVVQAQLSGRPEIDEELFNPLVQYMGSRHFDSQYPLVGSMGSMPQGSYNQPQNSSNPFDLPADFGSNLVSREFPSLSSMHQALPTLSMGPRPPSGPGFSAHGSHWGQTSGPLFPQQPQTVLSQSMQGSFEGNMPRTSLGITFPEVSLGMNAPGRLGNPDSFASPKQGLESFLPASTFQASQNLFGGADFTFPSQGAPGQFPSQNPTELTSVGNLTSADSLTTGPSGPHPLLSQGSIGSSSIVQGADPSFPSQPLLSGQLLVAQSSLGSLSSMTFSDAVQGSLYPSHPVGNPFA